jgi:hypothetical protein
LNRSCALDKFDSRVQQFVHSDGKSLGVANGGERTTENLAFELGSIFG